MSPANAYTPSQVTVSVNTSNLSAGNHSATLTLTGSLAGCAPVSVPVRLDVTADLGNTFDTLSIDPTYVESGQPGQTAVVAKLVNDVSHITFPVSFDISAVTIDSIVSSPALPVMISFESVVDNAEGLTVMEWQTSDEASYFDIGETYLGEIFFTAAEITTTTYLEPAFNDTLEPRVSAMLMYGTPAVVRGEISISPATGVEQDSHESPIESYRLAQNWPNPFNARTLIAYDLPRNSEVSIEIYNVLGQPVRRLVSEFQVAGSYTRVWDGLLENGQPAPSGVYFCRMQAGSESLVRRMVLVK
jgi:hypothetical protein